MSQDDSNTRTPTGAGATLLLVCSDLIFTTKISGTAQALGVQVVRAQNLASLDGVEPVRQVIVDLDTPGVAMQELQHIRARFPSPISLVAFGPHVDAERLRAARGAGFDLVLPRSEFSKRLPQILGFALTSDREPRSSPSGESDC